MPVLLGDGTRSRCPHGPRLLEQLGRYSWTGSGLCLVDTHCCPLSRLSQSNRPVTGSRWGPASSGGGGPWSPKGDLLGSRRVGHPGPDYQNVGDPTQVPAPVWAWEPWALGAELPGGGLVSWSVFLEGLCRWWGSCEGQAPWTKLLSVQGLLGLAGPLTPSELLGLLPPLRVECNCPPNGLWWFCGLCPGRGQLCCQSKALSSAGGWAASQTPWGFLILEGH